MRFALSALMLLAPAVSHAACVDQRNLALNTIAQQGFQVEAVGELTDADSRCRLDDLRLVSGTLEATVDRVAWHLAGTENLATAEGEVSLSLQVSGLRLTARVDDPWLNYMMAQQNRRNAIDARVETSWDLTEGHAELSQFEIDLPGENRFDLAYAVNGLTPQTLTGSSEALGAIGFERLKLEIEHRGFADAMILGFLVTQLQRLPGSPEALVAATKIEAQAIVGDLPDTVFDENTKNALISLIEEGPTPWGDLSLSITADPDLPLSRLIDLGLETDTLAPEALERAFDGVEVRLRFQPDTSIR